MEFTCKPNFEPLRLTSDLRLLPPLLLLVVSAPVPPGVPSDRTFGHDVNDGICED